MTTEAVHANIRAIQAIEAAYANFAATLADKLPEIEREVNQVRESLDERKVELRREIVGLEETISEAKEDEEFSWERQRLDDAEEALAAIQRRARKLQDATADYYLGASKAIHASNEEAMEACRYLRDAKTAISAYLARQFHDTVPNVPPSTNGQNVGSHESASKWRKKIRDAQFTSCRQLEGDDRGINLSYILRNGVKVVFKPAAGEYTDTAGLPFGIEPFTQYKREKAASVIDELLGTNLVPPTEIIKHDGLEGSAQLFREGFRTAQELGDAGTIARPYLECLSERQRRDFHLLHTLLGNEDNHDGNWMLRENEQGGFDLALIDHGWCLSEKPNVKLRNHPASGWELDSVDRERIEKLINTQDEWSPQIAELVGLAAVNYMKRRARDLIARNRHESDT